MTTQIVATQLNGDDRLAMVETVSLTVLALAALWLLAALGCGRDAAGGAGKGVAPARRAAARARRLRTALAVLGWTLALVLLLPHLTLLLVSFVPVGTWTTEPLPPAYTLRQLR